MRWGGPPVLPCRQPLWQPLFPRLPGSSQHAKSNGRPRRTGRPIYSRASFRISPLGKEPPQAGNHPVGRSPEPRHGPASRQVSFDRSRMWCVRVRYIERRQEPKIAPNRVPGKTGKVTRLPASPVTHIARVIELDRNPDIPKHLAREVDASALSPYAPERTMSSPTCSVGNYCHYAVISRRPVSIWNG